MFQVLGSGETPVYRLWLFGIFFFNFSFCDFCHLLSSIKGKCIIKNALNFLNKVFRRFSCIIRMSYNLRSHIQRNLLKADDVEAFGGDVSDEKAEHLLKINHYILSKSFVTFSLKFITSIIKINTFFGTRTIRLIFFLKSHILIVTG